MWCLKRTKLVTRAAILVLFGLLLAAQSIRADEQLLILRAGEDVYTNVTITSITPTDIYFTSANGMGSVKLKDLDPALQKHFRYDAAKAKAAVPDPSDPVAVMQDAMDRVRAIVNQPVTMLTQTSDMSVSVYQPGWFHPGAITPDFNTVDVRASQGGDYGQHQYVTSDLNPGVCFFGSEVEFNPMTKYFYTDRSLPKKKLTEAEMVEINRLYRIIGHCQEQINHPASAGASVASIASAQPSAGANAGNQSPGGNAAAHSTFGFFAMHLSIIASVAAGLLLVAMIILNLRKASSAS